MTQGDRADRDKKCVLLLQKLLKNVTPGISIQHRTAKHVRVPENRNMKN